MLEQITMRDLRAIFAPELEPDTVRVEVPELNPVLSVRVESTPRTSLAVEQ